jgi:transcriptional regulator with XRE-family HTH domain
MNQTPAALTGANVRAELARKGISQMTLAGHIGMTQASVSKRLRGEVAFNVDELSAVARVLDVPIASLLAEQPAST